MINIGQIGVGYWGPNLLRNLVASKRCKVPIVLDISKERREYVQGLYPAIQVTNDINELLENPEINGVIIATPVSTHFELAIRALQGGKHILVEKPLARSVSEIDEIDKLAKKKNLVVMAGHTFLFNAAVCEKND
jgi:predicted dehydrogenase